MTTDEIRNATFKKETEKAILISTLNFFCNRVEVWLPKSQIKITKDRTIADVNGRENRFLDIELPMWLSQSKFS
jgi:hypothetical protein